MLPRNPARIASAKCFTGKMSATVVIHWGASSSSGMKMPERNRSGRIAAFTMGGAASAFGIAAGEGQPQGGERQRSDEEGRHELEERAAGRDRRVVRELPEYERDRHEDRTDDHRMEHPGSRCTPRRGAGAPKPA